MSQQLHIDDIPKPKLSKKQQDLLALLQTGRRLSKQEILREVHIWNSGDQIMKLRRAGYKIECEMVTEGTNTFGRYFLEAVDSKAAA